MRLINSFLFTFLLAGNFAFSQTVTDSLSLKKKKLLKPFLNLDSRRSYFLDEWVRMNGLRLGLEYYEKYRFGLGFYGSDRVSIPKFSKAPPGANVEVEFNYNTVFFEYVFIENYRWEISAPLLWGSGTANFHYLNENGAEVSALSQKIPVISTNGVVEYKLIPILGLGLGLGYRFLFPDKSKIEDATQIRSTFNAPFYYLHLKLHFGELFKCLFNNDLYEEERRQFKEHRRNKKLNGS